MEKKFKFKILFLFSCSLVGSSWLILLHFVYNSVFEHCMHVIECACVCRIFFLEYKRMSCEWNHQNSGVESDCNIEPHTHTIEQLEFWINGFRIFFILFLFNCHYYIMICYLTECLNHFLWKMTTAKKSRKCQKHSHQRRKSKQAKY